MDCGHKFATLDNNCVASKLPTGLVNSSNASSLLDKLFAGDQNSIYPYGVDPLFLQ